jgi:hypothetical protein
LNSFRGRILVLSLLLSFGCSVLGSPPSVDGQPAIEDSPVELEAEPTAYLPMITIEPAAAPVQGGRVQPEDLTYLGAFRLPDGPPEIGWYWGGTAMTYYPEGDPNGPDDGFPGSIFGTGH